MCKCDPNCRTPWCGKPGCEMPEQVISAKLVSSDLECNHCKKEMAKGYIRDHHPELIEQIEWYFPVCDNTECTVYGLAQLGGGIMRKGRIDD